MRELLASGEEANIFHHRDTETQRRKKKALRLLRGPLRPLRLSPFSTAEDAEGRKEDAEKFFSVSLCLCGSPNRTLRVHLAEM
jgi:hypothetical protein